MSPLRGKKRLRRYERHPHGKILILRRQPDVPLYEYECQKCRKHVEKIEKMEGPHLKKCPRCGGRLERLMSAPAIQFKGSGWYVTDYARSSNRGAEKSDAGSASDKSESKTESKTESKPETKADAKTETKTASETKEKKKVANDK